MKKGLFFCLTICITCFCYGQKDFLEKIDSLALESRDKADFVLSKFDTICGKKMLYSLQDRFYYIIFERFCENEHYLVTTDGFCRMLSIKEISIQKEFEKLYSKKFYPKHIRKLLTKRLQDDMQTIIESFNINNYDTEFFITHMPSSTTSIGVPSYFVIKDGHNRRLCEYHLSAITLPCPININLLLFLNRMLIENIDIL